MMNLEDNDLIKALRGNCGYEEVVDNLGCGNKKCKYCDVDDACDIVAMCGDAADRIERLTAEQTDRGTGQKLSPTFRERENIK